MVSGYDPVKLAFEVRPKVSKVIDGKEYRRYFRFRGGRWYGGIATGDVIGCNLRCKFCWSSYFRDKYSAGKLLSPEEAYEELKRIAKKRGYKLLRLSGAEPTLTKDHLIGVLELSEEDDYTFILETNGILIGHDPTFAKDLAKFSNLVVRVSFKGASPDEFSLLTGANPRSYELQFKSVENLVKAGFTPGKELVVAIMASFSSDESLKSFLKRLSDIDSRLLGSIDWEVVILYPSVKRMLERHGLRPRWYVNP